MQLDLLSPLHDLPALRLLQVGSYTFAPSVQIEIARIIAQFLPSLNVLGLNGQDNDTTWWGIWRDGGGEGDVDGEDRGEEQAVSGAVPHSHIRVLPLSEGDLRRLEAVRQE